MISSSLSNGVHHCKYSSSGYLSFQVFFLRRLVGLFRIGRNNNRRNERTSGNSQVLFRNFFGFLDLCVRSRVGRLMSISFRRRNCRILTSVVRISFRNTSSSYSLALRTSILGRLLRVVRHHSRYLNARRRLKGGRLVNLRFRSSAFRSSGRAFLGGV